MIDQRTLVNKLNNLLDTKNYQDYGPNGLQIEGKTEIKKIAFAVSATEYSVNQAVDKNADMLIVHHGLFWKFHGAKTLTGAFFKRVAPLIKNNISLIGYHLPLDGHIEYGNASAIARKLNLNSLEAFGDYKGSPTGVKAKFSTPLTALELKTKLEKILNHSILLSTPDENAKIGSIGIITGGANSEWRMAKAHGLDAYLTGEMSEHDWHEAKEDGIHFFAGGHNATEQFGVQELMKYIAEEFKDSNLELEYIHSPNPA